MINIPSSDKVNTSSLARLFDNKSESYKLFWFKAILHEVSLGRDEIPFRDLIERMILDAWYMVSEYKLNLGPADTLEKTVLYISEKEDFLPTEKENILLDYLRESEDSQLRGYMRTLSLNVPYRLQAPLMPNPGAKIWYKVPEIIEYINSQSGIIYSIQKSGYLDGRIIITPEWMDYLQSNLAIIQGWVDYNLIMYLQRRNPTVPGISNKIYPPQKRKLSSVTKYWKYMIEKIPVHDIYTWNIMTTKGLSIDHFVPWSYVASDELWNLIPTFKTVNSSKSNNLPEWEVYFNKLARTEYEAYLQIERDETANHLFLKCAKDNLNNEEIRYRLYRPSQTEALFTKQLKEIILPVYESAKNMGFKEWVYKNE